MLIVAVSKDIKSVFLFDVWHRVLAEKVVADMDMPPFDKSAIGWLCIS
ncbi:MAG: hypothetical protein RR356_06605 [Bacteroidales bacterium]